MLNNAKRYNCIKREKLITCYRPTQSGRRGLLVRTLVFGWRTFPDLFL